MSYIKIDDARPEPNATTQNQPELAKNILKNSELAQTENANQSKSASESVYKNESHFASQITAQSTLDNLLIVCGHCGTTNRIPSSKLAEKPSCGQCKQPVFSEQPITLDSNISKHTQTNQVLTIVDFWASWCQPCHQMAPQFANASRQLPQVVFAKLQTDKYEHASTPYHIRSLPTLVAFKNGVEISRQSGVMSTGQIVQWVKHLG